MNQRSAHTTLISGTALAGAAAMLVIFGLVSDTAAQKTRKKRTTRRPAPVQQIMIPPGEAEIISRAEDFGDPALRPLRNVEKPAEPVEESPRVRELRSRVQTMEPDKKQSAEDKQKRLLMNIDILSKAEQRSESLRKQLFDLVEKESNVRAELDKIDANARPEEIEKGVAFMGTLRPEEARESRKKKLEADRTRYQTILNSIVSTKTNVELSLQRSDALVEKLRAKFEKEIDDALADETQQPF